MKTLKQWVYKQSELGANSGSHRMVETDIGNPKEVCFEGKLVTNGDNYFVFETEGIRVFIPKPKAGVTHLSCYGKRGTDVRIKGVASNKAHSEGNKYNGVQVEATSFEILEDPEVERPVGLPLSGRGTLLKLVAGDVICTPEHTLKTLSTLEAKIINESVNNGTDSRLDACIVSFANRHYKEQGEIKVPSVGVGMGGEEYTEEDIRTGRYPFEINLDGNDLETWKPCIDTLYRNYLKASMKQAQIKVDNAVKELAEFNKAYGEFVDYKEYQSKVLLRK